MGFSCAGSNILGLDFSKTKLDSEKSYYFIFTVMPYYKHAIQEKVVEFKESMHINCGIVNM